MNRRSWSPMNFLSLLTSWHLLEMVVLLAFWLAPAAHAQRASQASTFIQNGNLAISKPGGSVFHPGHTMVRFRRGAAPDFLPGSGSAVSFSALPGLFLVNNPPGLSVKEALKHYKAHPNVLYAEPDYYVQAVTTPTDPLWKDDPGIKTWLVFMDKYFPDGDKTNINNIYGYASAQTMVQVLKQCGDNLTRENVMKHAASLKDFTSEVLLPGIRINTAANDFFPIEQMQLMKFNGEAWEVFGDIITGEVGH